MTNTPSSRYPSSLGYSRLIDVSTQLDIGQRVLEGIWAKARKLQGEAIGDQAIFTFHYQGLDLRFKPVLFCGRYSLLLDNRDIEELGRVIGEEQKLATRNELSLSEAASAISINVHRLQDCKLIGDALLNRPKPIGYEQVGVIVRKSSTVAKPSIHLYREDLNLLCHYLHWVRPEQVQSGAFVDKQAAASALGTTINDPKFGKAWQEVEDATKFMKDGAPVKLDGQKVDIRQRTKGTKLEAMIAKDDLSIVKGLIEAQSLGDGSGTDWGGRVADSKGKGWRRE